MSNQTLSIGRIVHYNPTIEEEKALGQLGNNSSKKLPAMVVAVWGADCANLKVMVDGNHPDLWKTSVGVGVAPGQLGCWEWPQIKKS